MGHRPSCVPIVSMNFRIACRVPSAVGVKFRRCEVQIRNGERGHTSQHAAQGQAQRERGTSNTPRPKANAANTRTEDGVK
eukprot:2368740-Prymnesium_polylepis.1